MSSFIGKQAPSSHVYTSGHHVQKGQSSLYHVWEFHTVQILVARLFVCQPQEKDTTPCMNFKPSGYNCRGVTVVLSF